MRDSEIEQWVLREITLITGGRLKEICVFSLHGVISLMGTVQSRADRVATQKAAARAKGVVAVTNQINVRRRTQVRRHTVKSKVAAISGAFHFSNQERLGSSQVAG